MAWQIRKLDDQLILTDPQTHDVTIYLWPDGDVSFEVSGARDVSYPRLKRLGFHWNIDAFTSV